MAMPAPATEELLFNPYDPGFVRNPYPAYRRLRERAPVWRAPLGFWVLSRHADIAAALKDPRFGHDFEGNISANMSRREIMDEPIIRSMRLSMLVRDPPDHTRLRSLVVKAFTARRMESMRARIEAIVDDLLERIVPRGRMDVIGDFARTLPVIVICEMLGIPEEDRALFLSEYRVSGRALDPTPMTREELDTANANSLKNRSYFEDLFVRRQSKPGDDLISAMMQVRDEQDGRLSHDELASNIGLLFGAGHETTTNLIGNGLLALHRNRDQWERLKAEPSLAAGAVDELLRFDSSVQLTGRKAFEDVRIGSGPVIKRGESIICFLGSANRDPDVYPDPDRLDITRPGVRPLSFGGGIHYCLGAQLARIEGEIAFRRLVERLPNLELEDAVNPEWRTTITLRGLKSLPARW